MKYAVIGAGRQGVAAAYDLARFGDADEILLFDIDRITAEAAAMKVNGLLHRPVARAMLADVGSADRMVPLLRGTSAFISAAPYQFNLALTEAAVRTGASMCDLGGNTDIVRKQLRLGDTAKAAGISVVPDCGMGPGMNISLAVHAMSLLDEPKEVCIWDGGLPQEPEPPWNYALTFSIGGLTNEYSGNAYFLRDGKVTEVPCFEGYEVLDFQKPIGKLEAFVTSGGLSTAPWTFEGRLERLENKTLRYPGHWAQFKAFAQLGLLGTEKVKVGSAEVSPRDVFHALLEPKVRRDSVRDIGIIRTKAAGMKDGRRAEVVVELIDRYDEGTGFTAMQRLTGWHASIVAILAAQGRIPRGAHPVELAVPGKVIVEEARRRGFSIEERVSFA